jgi:hypothetical protein
MRNPSLLAVFMLLMGLLVVIKACIENREVKERFE